MILQAGEHCQDLGGNSPNKYAFQDDAHNAVVDAIAASDGSVNILATCPTGAGKSRLIARLARFAMQCRIRVLVLTHRLNLIEQDRNELIEQFPELADITGFYKGGCHQLDRSIVFGSVQSFGRRVKDGQSLGDFGLVIIDEAHLVSKDQSKGYGRIIAAMREAGSRVDVVGYTATPYRTDNGSIIGEDHLFTDEVYSIDCYTLTQRGVLAPLRIQDQTTVDRTRFATRGKDFDETVTTAVLLETLDGDTDRMLAAVRGRQSVIVFCQSQRHCVELAEQLKAKGETAAYVISGNNDFEKVTAAQRADIYERFRAGKIRFLIGCDVLTTGFNARNVDALIMARATTSRALYIQMLGRGTRTYPGKTDCLVCDFVGNVAEHGPYDVELTPQMARECAGQWKNCPRCGEQNHRSEPYCTECDHRFHGLSNDDFAAQNAVKGLDKITRQGLSVAELPHHKVTGREVFSYEKGGKQILVAKYLTATGRELASFHVVSGAGRKFGQQWWKRFTSEPMPTDRHEAARIAETFPVPTGVIEVANEADSRFPAYYETYRRHLPWRRNGGNS